MVNTWGEFFNAVVLMRESQKKYFMTRSKGALEEAKANERIVDECINQKAPKVLEQTQGDLFGGEKCSD